MQKQNHASEKKKVKSKDNLTVQKEENKIKKAKGQKILIKNSSLKDNKHKNIFREDTTKKAFWANIITKQNLVYSVLTLVDIILIVYFARKNVVNYVEVIGEEIFLSETRYLLLGRNYIALIVTFFFYVYTLAVQRFFFQKKLTKKYLVGTFFFYFILNVILFYLFTKRIY